ncbi:MAG TPA: IS1634 family transposase [Gaiellaceae bacterium]|nr:IS1634 family transposase [Gaiellaceae bacterium]
MAGTIVRKRKGGREYFYWVRSARVQGKPRIVEQVYLGTAEALKQARERQEPVLTRRRAAGPLVLWSEAERLGLRELVDAEVEPGGGAASVGTYLQLIACNRASAPCAKLRLRAWYEQTALVSALGLPARALDHRRVWDAMDEVSEQAIERIEERLVRRLVELGELEDGELLVFDPTNLFTFIASGNERSELARRGHSKQGRHDLRQVGLALMTSRRYRLPLLHHVYAGNQPDAPTFRELAERLRQRFRAVLEMAESVTLVYDRGSHSDSALTLFEPGEFHFVCGLQANRYRDRLEVAPDALAPIPELPGYQSARSEVMIGGRRYTLLCVRSDSFATRQQDGFRQTLAKAERELSELRRTVEAGRGRRSKSELTALVSELLKPRYLKRVLDVNIGGSEQKPTLAYRLDEQALALLEQRTFGRSLLLTDRGEWTDAEIVRAYHALNRNEEAIRRLKDPDHLAARPIYHWTDQKIRVHLFCCVLALLLTHLLWKRAQQRGLDASPQRLLNALAELDQIELVYPPAGDGRGRPRVRRHLGQPSPLQLDLLAALDFDPEQVGTTPKPR